MIITTSTLPKTRQHLSADALHSSLKTAFSGIQDHRRRPDFALTDALLSAFALFTLKDPSLLAFDARRCDRNLHVLFGIHHIPSDTQLREILDPVDPESLRPAFNRILQSLQRGKALENFAYYQGAYLLALDGTQYFHSHEIHCDSCLECKNRQTGEITYTHQMLGAAFVHPDRRTVIPLAPEPIIKQDGATKNDCERNAAKRLLPKIRAEHPQMKFIVIEDGLSSNAPHIADLKAARMNFILGVKPGDHAYLFDAWIAAHDRHEVTTIRSRTKNGGEVEISFASNLPLNASHPDLLVNFLQLIETDSAGNIIKQFTWVTDLEITAENAEHLARGGRARWKIENETFNTLKNQGYQFEHNFGHGKKHLSVVFAMLMMLAFLVDQTKQLCCPLFQAILKKYGTKRALWEHQRSHFYHFLFESMQHLYEVMLLDLAKEVPAPRRDSS